MHFGKPLKKAKPDGDVFHPVNLSLGDGGTAEYSVSTAQAEMEVGSL